MLQASLKARIKRFMTKNKVKQVTKTKSRVKGLDNLSDGFMFETIGDELILYWSWGNVLYRGRPNEEGNPKTEELYQQLVNDGLGEWIQLEDYDFRNRKVIRLKGE